MSSLSYAEFASAFADLKEAVRNNSEIDVLKVVQNNRYMLMPLYKRQFQPERAYHEIYIGSDKKCDFVWMNDDSDGPEWTIVEFEKPNTGLLFKSNGLPSSKLNDGIGQIRQWQSVLKDKSIGQPLFRSWKSFRYILVTGLDQDWLVPANSVWRADFNNSNFGIEVRSYSSILRMEAKEGLERVHKFIGNSGQVSTGSYYEFKDYVANNEFIKRFTFLQDPEMAARVR